MLTKVLILVYKVKILNKKKINKDNKEKIRKNKVKIPQNLINQLHKSQNLLQITNKSI